MSPDIRRIFAAQAFRAAAYGFTSVFLGISLEARGWSSTRVGLLLTAVVAGTALMNLLVGTLGDRFGRRRTYAALFLGLALSGAVFGVTSTQWVLMAVALTGTLSTDVVESGPFTSLEQGMLPSGLAGHDATRVFGWYNAVATLAGSLGALAAGGPALLRESVTGIPTDERFFLVLVPAGLIGAIIAMSLSDAVEDRPGDGDPRPGLSKSRPTVIRLSALFAMDSLAGGFAVQSFIAYWFRAKFDVSQEAIGAIFFGVGILQSASFMAATRIAKRFGLLNTMVFTHLPSNLLLAAIPLAPTLAVAIVLLLGRFALSQMDVPTRQAYIARLVEPGERTAAAAYTNSARYIVRPIGPALAGVAQQVTLGLPFFIAGGVKSVYDLILWAWFRRVKID